MGKYRTYCSLLISADDLFHSFHLMTFKINIMMKIFNVCCICCLLLACEKPYIADTGEDGQVVAPDNGRPVGEILWAENDTARFYLQGVELCDVVLTYSPTPSVLITNPRYRLPTKSEASEVLRYADLSDGCWMSKQRILCVDQSGNYYTFLPHSNVTKAGMKTKYCILPMRSERISEDGHVDITINDKWE